MPSGCRTSAHERPAGDPVNRRARGWRLLPNTDAMVRGVTREGIVETTTTDKTSVRSGYGPGGRTRRSNAAIS